MKLARRSFHKLLSALVLVPKPALSRSPENPSITPQEILPVHESSDPLAAALLEALLEGREIPLFYLGGTTPGALRRFIPHSLHRLRPGGPVYARGHCLLRNAGRTLRLDRARLA